MKTQTRSASEWQPRVDSDVNTLIVANDDGVPVALFVDVPGIGLMHYTAADDEFVDALRGQGFDVQKMKVIKG